MELVMTDPAGELLDDIDQAILDRVRTLHATLDPPPPDLNDRVRFAIALENIDVEVARLVEDAFVGSGARGSAEGIRTITFDGESRTIIVSVADTPDGRLRIDGWLAPAARLRVELRLAGPIPDAPATSETVVSEDSGRFTFDGVAHGLAMLVIHPIDGDEGTRIVTPSLVL
jgi:hypothetical protein